MLLYTLYLAGALAVSFTELEALDIKQQKVLSKSVPPSEFELQTVGEFPSTQSEKFSEELWNDTEEYRYSALNTTFVQGIKDGTLDPTVFGGYVIQDAIYLYEAQQSIAIAAERATNPKHKKYLEEKAIKYTGYYEAFFKEWHIQNATGIKLGDQCQSYVDFERYVANELDSIYFIVSMIPCAKLWPWLGEQTQTGNHGVYNKWYRENFNPNSTGYMKLDDFVDEAAGTIDKIEARAVYRRCMTGEFEFFNSAK